MKCSYNYDCECDYECDYDNDLHLIYVLMLNSILNDVSKVCIVSMAHR